MIKEIRIRADEVPEQLRGGMWSKYSLNHNTLLTIEGHCGDNLAHDIVMSGAKTKVDVLNLLNWLATGKQDPAGTD